LRLGDIIGTAFYNLWRKKLRTSLTVLAIVIGAVLITLMTSIGTGLKEFIVEQFGYTVPMDEITVYAGEVSYYYNESPHEISDASGEVVVAFTQEDWNNILSIYGVESIYSYIYVPALYVNPEGTDKKYSINIRTGPDFEIDLLTLVAGNHFDENTSGECLVSYDYLEAFGWDDVEDVVGRQITIMEGKYNVYSTETRAYTFTICGVIQKTVNSKEIIIPISDAMEMARYYRDNPSLYTPEQPGTILLVKAISPDVVGRIAQDIDELGFTNYTPDEILKEINTIFNIIQIGLSAFGVIALVVASIGIINTLMMSIYERTREIGVMKAVGATRGTIRLLFTMEGMALGLIGGIIGVVLGYGAGYLLNIIGSQTFLSDYPTFQMSVFSVELVIEVIAITTGISLIAGLYPANRAAKLNAVDALRYE
jgi:putative ABC transport system permease protein